MEKRDLFKLTKSENNEDLIEEYILSFKKDNPSIDVQTITDDDIDPIYFSYDKKIRILILGTHVTINSLNARLQYTNVRNNKFWTILESVFNLNGLTSLTKKYEQCFKSVKNENPINYNKLYDIKKMIVHCLKKTKFDIAISDIIGCCRCLSGRDRDIIPGTEKKSRDLDKLINDADLIVFNGRNTETILNDLIKRKRFIFNFSYKEKSIAVISTSGVASIKVEQKIKCWKCMINSKLKELNVAEQI